MGDSGYENTQFLSVNYRNGIYQGRFNKSLDCREGLGLIFTTDNHMVMGSEWHEDQANNSTFIFYNHAHYIYGFWHNNIPHGFNAVRMDRIVLMAFYDVGTMVGRILVIYEQYNLAVVLEKDEHQNVFVEVQKGEIFSDEDFNSYVSICGWPEFEQNWKTLIKFMSANFSSENKIKEQILKLRLVNANFYRFGFDQGIAVIFDDQYRIISAGVHKKAKIKSLGVKFTKENFIQQGNFEMESQIFAFNFGHRPDYKLSKIYSNYLLRNVQFVNKYLSNPAKFLIKYIEELIKSNLFRKLISGQITLRRLEGGLGSPGTNRKIQSLVQSNKIQDDQAHNLKKQQMQKIKQEKARLNLYKKQIFQSISKKSRAMYVQVDNKNIKDPTPQKVQTSHDQSPNKQIINKAPVEVATRSGRRKQANDQTKTKSRSPIFTPEKNYNRSPSASNLSPFKEKIKSKIFESGSKKEKKNIYYEPIEAQLYPKLVDIAHYSSPHEELQFSKSRANQGGELVLPVSVNKDVRTKYKDKQASKQQVKIDKIKQKQKEYQQENRRRASKEEKQKVKNQIRDSNNPTFRVRHNQDNSKQYTNTNIPNIIISTPSKNKSVHKYKKIIEIQDMNNQNTHLRKNDIYLKGNKVMTQVSPERNRKKSIKGSTYLQKYGMNKLKQKQQQAQQINNQNNKYNRTIKSFNQNNKVYEKVQSPSDQKYQSKGSYGQKRQRINENKYEKKQSPQKKWTNNQIADNKRKYVQQTSPIKRKYQYIYE